MRGQAFVTTKSSNEILYKSMPSYLWFWIYQGIYVNYTMFIITLSQTLLGSIN